ncbi:MAG: AAA family ATPase [Patescibacteria group bacterium]|jgi:predicted ATP-dependent endonuclease of OLD family
MRIKELNIQKYRGINDPFYLKNPGKIHIFIGQNNVGKTSILDAINQLYSTKNIKLCDKNARIDALFSLTSDLGTELELHQRGNLKVFYLDGEKITLLKAQNILKRCIIRLRATNPPDVNLIRKDYLNFKEKYPDEFKRFTELLNEKIPKLLITDDIFVRSSDNMAEIFNNLGDGFKSVFTILLYLFHPQYTILLLEEPEIHLHPALVKKLLDIIENENNFDQIFLTTHSPIFIHTTNLHRLFRVTRDEKSIHVYSPRLLGKKINYDRLKQELNAENCEMFFADKVLLVEGPSDHILMRSMIDRFYHGEKNIKVIQTYGKSNIDIYADLLEMFNIPFIVLLDRDALYDTAIKVIQKVIKGRFAESEIELINKLKRINVYIFSNGSIENNYPRKYQRRRNHKPQNAILAASNITESDYNSLIMKNIREVIENI